MVEFRSVGGDEMQDLEIFPSEYETRTVLRLVTQGAGPELTWQLEERALGRRLSRRLDSGGWQSLENLYGPTGALNFFGAFEGARLTGLLTWKHEAWNDVTWLCDIRIRKECRRQGIGTRLLEDLKWSALRCDARGIMLETQTTNYPAIQFYTSSGFELAGLNTRFYANLLDDPAEAALFFFLPLE